MSEESAANLLFAYKSCIEIKRLDIADLLESVILDVMDDGTSPIVVGHQTTLEPPWNVTCGPDTVKLGTTVTCTGIDQTSKEVTS